ncbi:hypothetical protein BS17DRAFT_132502 [Gyrodon lividus]|nr:hypothetical protein BS17DRAFT_132502 [Gyrodon lividus]
MTDVIKDTGLYGDLPTNPKQWNTNQLTTYLSTSLRKGDDLDDLGVEDVLDCVRKRGFTGRELLRLTDADLVSTALSDSQRARLLENSLTLRADVLRGRIYVDSYHSKEISDHSKDIYTRSIRSVKSSPFHNNIYGSSVSSVDLLLPKSFDLNGDLPLSPTTSLRHSNPILEASAQRYRDLAHIRTRRRGKVKGLVDSWQRESGRASTSGGEYSMSEGSESDAESESSIDQRSDVAPHDEPSSPLETSSLTTMADSTIILRKPPHYTSPVVEDEEELSMEELLASSVPLQGARAWEADVGLGETVKYIPIASVSLDPSRSEPAMSQATAEIVVQKDSVRSKGSREGTGSRGRNARSQKRVVTAIFTGSPSAHQTDKIPKIEEALDLADPTNGNASGMELIEADQASPTVSQSVGESDDVLCALEDSLAATRAQLEGFRLRLEAVEADTARHEAELQRDPSFIPCHSTSQDGGDQPRKNVETEDTIPHEGTKQEPGIFGALGLDCLRDITQSIVARAMGWAFPYSHPGLHTRPEQSRVHVRSRDGSRSPAPRPPLPPLRVSYIIWFSFAICAAILRRAGFGRWVRKP